QAAERRAGLGRRARDRARFPDLRLLDAPANPDRQEGGRDADEEDAAPAPARKDEEVDERGQAVPDRPRTLHEPERFATVLGGERFRDERSAARPLAAHADADADAEDRE